MDIPDLSDLSDLGLPEKEQKILEASIKIFSEKGFSAATTSEIAKNAGVAEGTIFRYFKTKKDILRGILIQMLNLVSAKLVMSPVEKILAANGDKDLRTILKELLYDRYKLLDSVFPMAKILLTEALHHEDVREAVYQNIISKAFVIFKEFHAQMAEKGILRRDINPDILLTNVAGSMVLFIAQRKLFSDKFTFDDIEKELDQMVEVIINGIGAHELEK